jgi:hypothetical protein
MWSKVSLAGDTIRLKRSPFMRRQTPEKGLSPWV